MEFCLKKRLGGGLALYKLSLITSVVFTMDFDYVNW